jgi:hypothetical protein
MAAFKMIRQSYGAQPNRGRKATMNDAAMLKVFDAYRQLYGAGLTDDEVTDKMFDELLTNITKIGDREAKLAAAKTASEAVAPINAPITSDNT